MYLQQKLSKDVTGIMANRILQALGYGIFGLFLPIFLLQKFQNLNYVLLYVAILAFLQGFLTPLGAIIMSRIGIKSSMILATPFILLFFVFLNYIDINIVLFAGLSLLASSFYRILYWVPYHTDFALVTSKKERAKQYSILSALFNLIAIVIPIASGALIQYSGFFYVFFIAFILYGLSIIPLLKVKKQNETYQYGFWESFPLLFKKKNRPLLWTFMSEGVENMVGLIIWPIFMWQILDGNFLEVGAISSLIILVSVVLQLMMGKWTDTHDKNKLLKYGSMLYSVGWLLKIFVTSAFHIFIASVYHRLSTIVFITPFASLMYEQASEAGHYVDEYSVFREMALCLGRLTLIAFLFVLFPFTQISVAFLIAALASLFMNYITESKSQEFKKVKQI